MSFFCCLKGEGAGGTLSNGLSSFELLGSSSNDDGDGNENGKKGNRFRACLHGGGGPQIGEVTCDGSPSGT